MFDYADLGMTANPNRVAILLEALKREEISYNSATTSVVGITFWQNLRQQVKDRLNRFWTDHPYITKAIFLATLAGTMIGLYGLFNWASGSPIPKPISEGLSGEVHVLDALNVTEQNRAYAHMDRRAASSRPNRRIDGPKNVALRPAVLHNRDNNLADLIDYRLKPNSLWIEGPGAAFNAMCVKGRLILMNFHCASKFTTGQSIRIYRGKQVFNEIWDSSKLASMVNDDDLMAKVDVALYECGPSFPCGKDISDRFIPIERLQLMYFLKGVYYGKKDREEVTIFEGDAQCLVQNYGFKIDVDGKSTQLSIASGWQMSATTSEGYCGAILCAQTKGTKQKIIGIHSGYDPVSGLAFSTLVSESDINLLISQFEPQVVEAMEECEELKSLQVGEPKEVFDNITSICQTNIPNNQPGKHTIIKSPLQGVFPHSPVTQPSVLWNGDNRVRPEIRGCDLMAKQLRKYDGEERHFLKADVAMACDSVSEILMSMKPVMRPRVLSVFEAINGIPDFDFYDGLPMNTSPGLPYVLTRPQNEKGKRYLFDGEDRKLFIKDDTLQKNLDRRLEFYKLGKIPFSVWTNCLKAERRKIAKIENAETRAFMMAPCDYNLVSRMYFMDFCSTFYNSKIQIFSGVGIDPDSSDWTLLYWKHLAKGKFGFDEDFKNYDGTEKAEVMAAAGRIIDEWYGGNQEDSLVRKCIIEELIHTKSTLNGTLIQKHHGMPSGAHLTTVLNTVVHAIYTRIAYLIAMRKARQWNLASMKIFAERVADTFYGDDGLITADDEILRYFNRQSVVAIYYDYGITCTGADKTLAIARVDSLSALQFLKRRFAPHPTRQKVLAPIEHSTIYELINWITTSGDKEEQLRMNIEDACRFAYHYGKKFYDGFRTEVRLSLQQTNRSTSVWMLQSWLDWDEIISAEWCHFNGERILD
jgi:hypothetical protein